MSQTESAIKTARCPKCDAEVRDGSVFCYNCGGQVADLNGNESNVDDSATVAGPATKPAPGLRSARDLRRRERTPYRKPREVVWKAADAVPDLQLIVVTIGIIIFTIVVILMVIYLR